MRRSRTTTWLALLASLLMHAALLAWCGERQPHQAPVTTENRVQLTVRYVEPPPPPVIDEPPPVRAAVKARAKPTRKSNDPPSSPPTENAPPPEIVVEVQPEVPAPSAPVADRPTEGITVLPGLFAPGREGGRPSTGKGPDLMLGGESAAKMAVRQSPAVDERRDPPALQKAEWKYGAFLERIKSEIRKAWRPEKMLERRLARDGQHAVKGGRTDVQVRLRKDGVIQDVNVTRSVSEFLDDEVVRAVRSISPVLNAPEGVFNQRGEFVFNVGLEVRVVPPPAVNRFLQSRGSALGLVSDLINGDATDVRWCFTRRERCGSGCLDTEPLMTIVVEQCDPPTRSGPMAHESPMGVPR